MKNILILLAILLSSASAVAQMEDQCAVKALKAYRATGVINDYGPFTLSPGQLIPAGTSFALNALVKLVPQDQDTILYTFAGSHHSGYFRDGVLVDAKNCSILSIFNIEAE